MRWVALMVIALAGCDRLFELGHVGDAATGDAVGVADSRSNAIVFTQHVGEELDGSVGVHSMTFETTSKRGDVILATTTYDDLSVHVVGVSDSAGNTYARVIGPGNWAVSQFRTEMWAASVTINTGSPLTVTFEYTPSTNSFSLVTMNEFTNVAAAPIDQSSFSAAVAPGTAIATPAQMTTHSNELLFAHGEGLDVTLSAGSGFTSLDSSFGNNEEEQLVTATGSYAATFDLSAAGEWAAYMITLQ